MVNGSECHHCFVAESRNTRGRDARRINKVYTLESLAKKDSRSKHERTMSCGSIETQLLLYRSGILRWPMIVCPDSHRRYEWKADAKSFR